MFWYPGLDAGLNTSRLGGDIAFPIGKIGSVLPSPVNATSSQVVKPLDKSSFQCYNLFYTMKTHENLCHECKECYNFEFSLLPYDLNCVDKPQQIFSVHREIEGIES